MCKKMKKIMIICFAGVGLISTSCHSTPPPPLQAPVVRTVPAKPPKPGVNFIWIKARSTPAGNFIPGHWQHTGKIINGKRWRPGHYTAGRQWVPGRWVVVTVKRPRPSSVWIRGHHGRGGVWINGHWR